MLSKKIIVLIYCIAMYCSSFAQEQLGLRLENYSGINALSLNPSASISYPLRWDLNVAGGGFFIDNNYAWLQNSTVRDARQRAENIVIFPLKAETNPLPANPLYLDFDQRDRRKFVSVYGLGIGPGFMFNLRNTHFFSISTAARFMFNTRSIPAIAGYYRFDTQPFYQPIDIPSARGASMAWSELNFNYAYSFETSFGRMGAGATIKYLNGYEGFFADGTLSVRRFKGDTLGIERAAVDFGFTEGALEDTPRLESKGNGFGIELGTTLLFGDADDYTFKLGASLLDIGSVRFDKKAQLHRIDSNTPFDIKGADFASLTEPSDANTALKTISQLALADSLESLQGNEFSIALPSALSLQADYKVMPYFYVNALLVQRIPIGSHPLLRDNNLAITPRFEHRWFSAMLSLRVHEWQRVRMGLAARLGYLSFGTDNIGSFVGKSDLTGTDFYLALRVNPFKIGWLEGKGGAGKGRRRGKRGVKCYEF